MPQTQVVLRWTNLRSFGQDRANSSTRAVPSVLVLRRRSYKDPAKVVSAAEWMMISISPAKSLGRFSSLLAPNSRALAPVPAPDLAPGMHRMVVQLRARPHGRCFPYSLLEKCSWEVERSEVVSSTSAHQLEPKP